MKLRSFKLMYRTFDYKFIFKLYSFNNIRLHFRCKSIHCPSRTVVSKKVSTKMTIFLDKIKLNWKVLIKRFEKKTNLIMLYTFKYEIYLDFQVEFLLTLYCFVSGTTYGFDGCIRRLKINSKTFLFSNKDSLFLSKHQVK